jgi:fructose-specific phosphotransferase system IIC component
MTRKSVYPGLSCGVALTSWLFAGCTRAPSFDIVGSLFPAWLVCLVMGLLLTVLVRWLLLRRQITIIFPMLVYPSLAALFTCLLWLVFFS